MTLEKHEGRCEIKNCRNEADYVWYNHDICHPCYVEHCQGKIDLKKIFNIED